MAPLTNPKRLRSFDTPVTAYDVRRSARTSGWPVQRNSGGMPFVVCSGQAEWVQMVVPEAPARTTSFLRGRPLRTIAGMVGGLATWIAIAGSDLADPVMAMARPIGKLSLDALTMTVVPLVFALLATGIAGAAEGASGRVARHAML